MRHVGSSSRANLLSSRVAVTKGRFKNYIGCRQQSQRCLRQRGKREAIRSNGISYHLFPSPGCYEQKPVWEEGAEGTEWGRVVTSLSRLPVSVRGKCVCVRACMRVADLSEI